MSWQSYVDVNLLGTEKVHKAAILGLKGGVWASSEGYNLSAEEQKEAVKAFNDPEKTQKEGVQLAGRKFYTLSADGRSVYAKKGADGCVLVKTKQAVLVTEYNPPVQQPEAVKIVEELADYLIGLEY